MGNLLPNSKIFKGVRFVEINGGWVNTQAIESVRVGEDKQVQIRTVSGDVILVTGVYSLDTFTRGIFGKRFEEEGF